MASKQETCTGKHSQAQSRSDDGVSPGLSPIPTPNTSKKKQLFSIRRQGGGGGTEGVIDNVNPADRRSQHCHPPPETGLGLCLLGWLVGWLARLS